uniref:Uncharacterized protein n=1 Tax=Candidatus Nitrotoga fabula TaxID=2182327 RepID=A0A2X0QRH6_9PROT|nr:protein of unknown function [Candidatus Nitrotoga fabula]
MGKSVRIAAEVLLACGNALALGQVYSAMGAAHHVFAGRWRGFRFRRFFAEARDQQEDGQKQQDEGDYAIHSDRLHRNHS